MAVIKQRCNLSVANSIVRSVWLTDSEKDKYVPSASPLQVSTAGTRLTLIRLEATI